MEFPYGHNNHHHHHNRYSDEESDNYPPPQFPPPPSYDGAYPHAPPHAPPQVAGVHHISHNNPQYDSQNYPPPPPQPQPYGGSHPESGGPHHFMPHMPGFMEGHFGHSTSESHDESGVDLEGYFGNKQSHRIYCKASENSLCVGIRDGKVVLAYADPNDVTQHWYKDEKYSTKVKDEDGYPSFSLVNKGTGQAMKHPVSGEPVDLVPYKPGRLDGSILWTESKDLGSGYRTIRNVNNAKMVLDAFNGDKDHGGVHDGTFLSIFKCWKGDNQNQQWKIFPY